MGGLKRRARVVVLFALVSACASPPTATGTDAGAGDASACYEPPWYPAQAPSGVQVSMCQDDRDFRFVLGTGEPATEAQQAAFAQAHIAEFFAIDGVVGAGGSGLCCIEDKVDPNDFCVPFQLRLCTTALPAFIDKIRALQAQDTNVANRAMRVLVELQGLTGPRCEADAPDCGPIPYDSKVGATPPEQRTPVHPVPADGKACTYDGECVANGCGNECDHWTRGGAAGTCPYLTELTNAFCGCVEERCAWFQ